MSEPLISAIVPIYNVEAYLRECVDSILHQTYSNLEIVLVDDGSPDKCPEICDEYAKKDNRVKVIHQKNGGLAKARNVGLNNATGEYITFIDSDDFVSKRYIEFLYRGAHENDADISIATFSSFSNKHVPKLSIDYINFKVLSKSDCFERYTSMKTNVAMPLITAWNKLYKKELFLGIVYPEGKLYEDAFTTYKLFDKAKKIIYSPMKLYCYRRNPQSILGESFREKHLEMIDAFKEGSKYFQNKAEKNISEMFTIPLLMREIYCWWGAKTILGNKKLANDILKAYKTDSQKLKKKKNIGYFWFVIFKVIAICPWLYIWYRKLCPQHVGDR